MPQALFVQSQSFRAGADYPSVPPLILLENTGGGTARFNPNLYADGKGQPSESLTYMTLPLTAILVQHSEAQLNCTAALHVLATQPLT